MCPPRHLLRPVHSTGRRRQGHPADGTHVQSIAETVRPCCAVHCTHPLCEKLPPARRDYTDLGCQGARRLLQQKILVATSAFSYKRGSVLLYMSPFSYKRGGMRRYNTSSIFRLRPKSSKTTQPLKQYTTHWSRVLRSGGLNHSKLLRVLVFIPSSRNKQNA